MNESLPGSNTSAEGILGPVTSWAKFKRVIFSILAVVVSAALFFVSWITMGWGVVFGDRSGAFFFACGTTVYFISLWIAIHSQVRALIATITFLGMILGILVVLISVQNTFQWKLLPIFVVFWIGANGAFFNRALRRRKVNETRVKTE